MEKHTNYEFELLASHHLTRSLLSLLTGSDDLDILNYFETAYTVEAEDYEKLNTVARAIDAYVLQTIDKIPNGTTCKVERDLLRDYIVLCFSNWSFWKKSDDLFQDDSIAAKLFLDKLHLTIDSAEAKAIFSDVYDCSMRIYEIEEVAEGQVEGAKEAILFELKARKKVKKISQSCSKNKKRRIKRRYKNGYELNLFKHPKNKNSNT